MSIQMTAKKACRYGNRRIEAGEEFPVNGESDARLYHALGWASKTESKPEAKPAEPMTYQTRALEAPAEPTSVAVKTTRRYLRRDLTAKED